MHHNFYPSSKPNTFSIYTKGQKKTKKTIDQ